MEESSRNDDLSRQSSDPRESQEGCSLLADKRRLEEMRNMLLYDLDFRRITTMHIDQWESVLREIIARINKIQNAPQTYAIISSYDGLQDAIWRVIQKLYLASDLIPKKGVNDRERLYKSLRESEVILAEAIDIFYKI